jgi:hypothetical protein
MSDFRPHFSPDIPVMGIQYCGPCEAKTTAVDIWTELWVYSTPNIPVMGIQYCGPCDSEKYTAAKEGITSNILGLA